MRTIISTIIFIIVIFSIAMFGAEIDVVKSVRAKYPNLPGNRPVTVTALREIATELKAGLLKKTTGNNCLGYACDIICKTNGDTYDVFGDWEKKAVPQWYKSGNGVDPRNCEFIFPPPPPTDSSLINILEEMQAHIDELNRLNKLAIELAGKN